ncbi:MAG: amidohydrolase family protein [Oscillospiraceae bacterium]|nr:amidohydrolase family protein [Oscillospiraceae bacterium]
MTSFILKGDICHSIAPQALQTVQNAYLVCIDGQSAGIFQTLPEQYKGLPLVDYSKHLILPGLTDLHIHAPQFGFRALGMDLELIDWLNTHTFPEEARYADLAYADGAYKSFVQDLRQGPTTRANIFATRHVPATIRLMDLLEHSGLITMVGKVNMDRNAPAPLKEQDASTSLADTQTWLTEVNGRYSRTAPILTPRFIPACSDELMAGLGQLQLQWNLPVQSHLSENKQEITWVKDLVPEAESYAHAYYQHGLFGGNVPTVMAHCVWPDKEELTLMQAQKIWVAHCPQSNMNLSSGIAPIRKFLNLGIPVGLGSDVAGGVHTSIFRAISDAIAVSKLYWRLMDQTTKPLTLEEAFYLATRGGGGFFGKVGSFQAGYDLDALIIDDSTLTPPRESLPLPDRLARVIYLSDNRHIQKKYVQGMELAL